MLVFELLKEQQYALAIMFTTILRSHFYLPLLIKFMPALKINLNLQHPSTAEIPLTSFQKILLS